MHRTKHWPLDLTFYLCNRHVGQTIERDGQTKVPTESLEYFKPYISGIVIWT